jgi:hypothetical protein
MSVFTLHSNVLADYRDFVHSFFTVADDRAREFIDRELVAQARLWPEALLQVSPSYARMASVDAFPARQGIRYILDPADVHGPDFPGETFRVLKQKETTKFGEYRTRRLVLEAWDRFAPASADGQ